jgi:hypothetical protein
MQINPDKQVIKAFLKDVDEYTLERFGNGHIHHTFMLRAQSTDKKYILQALNKRVFPDPDLLVKNHLTLQDHLSRKKDPTVEIPKLVPLHFEQSHYLFEDRFGNTWRLMDFIPDSYSVDQMQNPAMAGEAGKAYGWFIRVTRDLDTRGIPLSIPKFHDLRYRLYELDLAVAQDRAGRKKTCDKALQFFESRRFQLLRFFEQVDSGHIPLRITHNDTKINNVLFRENEAVAVIDLDTVGPGIIHYDYGDSLRTIANTAVEDEQNLKSVTFNEPVFQSFTCAYLKECASFLSPSEKSSLYLAPRLMTYIIGIRFLTDYLNGDQYFHTQYPEHNMVRSSVQQKLLTSMEEQELGMKKFIQQSFDKIN